MAIAMRPFAGSASRLFGLKVGGELLRPVLGVLRGFTELPWERLQPALLNSWIGGR